MQDEQSGSFEPIDAQWLEWLQHNLDRGCTQEKLLATMIDGRIPESQAHSALAQVNYLRQHRAQPGWTHCSQPFLASRLSDASMIDLGDRHAHLLMRLRRPDLALYDNVLSGAECDELIALARNRTRRSTVIDANGVAAIESDERTSAGRGLKHNKTPLVGRIEQRLARLCNWPPDHAEQMQILHYTAGTQYTPHTDYFSPQYLANSQDQGGQRIATVLLYLNDVAAGGGTRFPHVGLTIAPRRGCALYFAYTAADQSVDTLSLHAGLPVEQGEKWLAVKWLRQSTYRRAPATPNPPASLAAAPLPTR